MMLFLIISMIPCLLIARPGYFEPWGMDADLKIKKEEPAKKNLSIPTQIADSIIKFHQQVLSPVDGPRSHFRPTSSRYMQLAMYRYGFVRGVLMGLDRLLRENDDPWVYRTIEIDGRIFKYDPASENKYQ